MSVNDTTQHDKAAGTNGKLNSGYGFNMDKFGFPIPI
jgi:hypothetical protein